MTTDQVAIRPKSASFKFTARRGPFLRLLLLNLLLTILTLGIYRFWAKTNVRKFIWSNIHLMGDPLEYIGKPSELLLGFLIILGVLFPLLLIYQGIGYFVPPQNALLHYGLEALYYFVLLMLIQVAFYRAWRYRMSRTTWRGIRLNLRGSTWGYLKISIKWTLIAIITLGLAYPWMFVKIWRYQITHTHIGGAAIKFRGSAEKLFPTWMTCIFFCLISLALIIGTVFLTKEYLNFRNFDFIEWYIILDKHGYYRPPLYLGIGAVGLFLSMFALTFIWFKLRALKYQIHQTRIRKSRLRSKLPISRLMFFGLITFILVVGTIVGAYVIYISVIIKLMGSPFDGGVSPYLWLYIRIAYFVISASAFFLLLPLFVTFIFDFELLKQVFNSSSVTNPENLDRIAQSNAKAQKTGEGLADALDIGGL